MAIRPWILASISNWVCWSKDMLSGPRSLVKTTLGRELVILEGISKDEGDIDWPGCCDSRPAGNPFVTGAVTADHWSEHVFEFLIFVYLVSVNFNEIMYLKSSGPWFLLCTFNMWIMKSNHAESNGNGPSAARPWFDVLSKICNASLLRAVINATFFSRHTLDFSVRASIFKVSGLFRLSLVCGNARFLFTGLTLLVGFSAFHGTTAQD